MKRQMQILKKGSFDFYILVLTIIAYNDRINHTYITNYILTINLMESGP
jgi:hypothetical protein